MLIHNRRSEFYEKTFKVVCGCAYCFSLVLFLWRRWGGDDNGVIPQDPNVQPSNPDGPNQNNPNDNPSTDPSTGAEGKFVKVTVTGSSFEIWNSEITWNEYMEIKDWATSAERGENKYEFPSLGSEYYENTPVLVGFGEQKLAALLYCNARSEKEELTPYYRLKKSSSSTEEIFRNYNDFSTGSTGSISSKANGYRIPQIGEWQAAFQGGYASDTEYKKTPYGKDASGNAITTSNLKDFAVYVANSTGETGQTIAEPRTKKPNSIGLYDMSGNAAELVHYRRQSTDWFGAASLPGYGGNFQSPAEDCTYDSEVDETSVFGSISRIGFRIVKTVN